MNDAEIPGSELFTPVEIPAESKRSVSLPARWAFGLMVAYVVVFPCVVAPSVVALLQTSDIDSARAAVRAIFFPFGDIVIIAQAITQAFVGHVTDPSGAKLVSTIPVFIASGLVGAIHMALVSALSAGVVGLVRLIRRRSLR